MLDQADVVVIGAGASGIGAALTLTQAGKKVALLEKGNKPGGAGMFGAQGLFAVESKAQQESSEVSDRNYKLQDAYKELIDYTHYRSNLALTRKVLQESASTIAWLADNGLKTELVDNTQEVHQGHPRVYHQYIDKFAGFQRLLDQFSANGGEILTETAAVDLQTNGGQITGVQVEHADQRHLIETKVVIVADGGYVGNKKLVEENLQIDAGNLYSMGERKATGDGISMLAKLGADTSSLGVFENHAASAVSPTDPKWHNDTIFTLTNLPFLWINSEGKRFVNEDICYDFALWGNITYTQGGFYYFLLNQEQVDFLQENKLEWTHSFERTFTSLSHEPVTHEVGPFPTIADDLDDAIKNNLAWKAGSIEKLANKLDLSLGNLQATVARYNQLINENSDLDFNKHPKFLAFPFEKGPYYAIKAQSTTLGTIGGISVNDDLEVIGKDKKPIQGAFAVGNNAAGMYGTSYPTLEGVSCAFAWNSGRLAGKAAVKLLEQGCEKYYH